MAYVYYRTTEQQSYLYVTREIEGYKLTPFVKDQIQNCPFLKHRMEFLEGNTHLVSGVYRAGGTLWGELSPTHEDNAGITSYDPGWNTGSPGNQAYARAYSKFKGKVYTQAADLTALRERQSTIDMVAKRLSQVLKGAKALKKGRFKEFLSTFGIKPKNKHKDTAWSRPADFGSLWLEYWMGWAPTVGDIYSSLEALGQVIPDHTVRAGSSVPISGHKVQSAGSVATSDYEGKVTVWVQAQVVVTNPSLFQLQSLGLANPFLTVWETTPFSWMADWFTNVGQVIGQLTDWLGLQLKNLVVSVKTQAICSWTCTDPGYVFGWVAMNGINRLYRKREYLGFTRKLPRTMPTVKPILRLPNGLSITRGATLASLLVTIFSPTKKLQSRLINGREYF